jgi:hypothetical protein
MTQSATDATHATANDPALQERFKRDVLRRLEATPFRVPSWLTNAHAQTIWSRYGHRAARPLMELERWDTPDGDFLRIHTLETHPEAPTALLLHGLEGCVESTYLVRLIHVLRAEGFNVMVMEHRSCGGEMNRARRLYHSGETTDADFVVREFGRRNPGRSLYIAGYSLGANVTAKWLGEQGDDTPAYVQAAAVVSAPYDLMASGPWVDSGVRRQIYARHFLRKLIPKAIAKEQQYPGSLDIERIKRATTFREFDTHGTAALHGFRDADDYYTQSACGQFLANIRRPTLLLSAADDPFNPGTSLPRRLADESPYLHGQFTERGGHVGFVGLNGGRRVTFWAEDQIARFFAAYRRLLT